MQRLSLTTVGAVCAILMFVSFASAIPLMAGSGVQVLIPETGAEGLEWIADVNAAGGAFFVGAWLTIIGGYFGMIALVGFYDIRCVSISGNGVTARSTAGKSWACRRRDLVDTVDAGPSDGFMWQSAHPWPLGSDANNVPCHSW